MNLVLKFLAVWLLLALFFECGIKMSSLAATLNSGINLALVG